MDSEQRIEKFKNLIQRQRTNPKIWDYSYRALKNNLNVFRKFRDLVEKSDKVRILDVGCGFKPWLSLFSSARIEYIGVDFDKTLSYADFVGSAENLVFEDNAFDALIYSESLEHVAAIEVALKEMRRVARNNALIFISSPFVFPTHGIPYDFQRLTEYFYKERFKNDEIILIQESNSSLATAFLAFNLFIESSPLAAIKGIKNVFFAFINIVSLLADAVINFVFSNIGTNFKKHFYLMPLSYALVVKIRK